MMPRQHPGEWVARDGTGMITRTGIGCVVCVSTDDACCDGLCAGRSRVEWSQDIPRPMCERKEAEIMSLVETDLEIVPNVVHILRLWR